MRTSQLLERPTGALLVIASLIATPSLGGPGDRIDRFPIELTGTIGRADQDPQLAMDKTGRFIAAWKSDRSDGRSVTFRRFAADGRREAAAEQLSLAAAAAEEIGRVRLTWDATTALVRIGGSAAHRARADALTTQIRNSLDGCGLEPQLRPFGT